MSDQVIKRYSALPSLRAFHKSPAQIRCIVGPVGSGKTSAATMEICYYLPQFLYQQHDIKRTRWAVVRNTYVELRDTTQKTVFDWFPDGKFKSQANEYLLKYENGVEVELLFRSCDRPEDVKKFKSLEITGYWIDESIEVQDEIKRMLKNRIGRYPSACPCRFGIETTNPPDVEHLTYSQFKWTTPPPGPIPERQPLENHVGFWQPAGENSKNLRPGYYDDLRRDYAENKDWADMYVDGKPGVIIHGKLIYNNFRSSYHQADAPLVWARGPLYRGWDNSGNTPAAVVVQVPRALHYQIMAEFTTDREGIVDFTRRVVAECNQRWPGAKWTDFGDPAGENKYSKKDGGFTSNKQLQKETSGVDVQPSEQNLRARIESVEQTLGRIDGLLIDPSCIRLLNGFLGGYCYPKIGVSGRYGEDPEKNRFSHVHDALQYLMVRLAKSQKKISPKTGRRPIITSSDQAGAWMGA